MKIYQLTNCVIKLSFDPATEMYRAKIEFTSKGISLQVIRAQYSARAAGDAAFDAYMEIASGVPFLLPATLVPQEPT